MIALSLAPGTLAGDQFVFNPNPRAAKPGVIDRKSWLDDPIRRHNRQHPECVMGMIVQFRCPEDSSSYFSLLSPEWARQALIFTTFPH
jgi:hypothetical protein